MPLVFDDQRRQYHIPGTYFLPPTNFTAEEALAVITLCHELGDDTSLPFFQSARSAAVKFENSLPHRLRDYMRDATSAIQIKLAPVNPLEDYQQVYNQLVDSISRRQCVRIRYDSLAENESINTKLSPYRVFFSQRSWYVVGRSSLHRSTRMFHVGRIEHLESLEDTYRIPRGFSVERYLGNAWRLIPEPGPDQEVEIRFFPPVTQNVAEVLWHKTQQTEYDDDGNLIFRATVSGLGEICWWVLGYGDRAEVLKPKKLRDMVAQRIQGMAARYPE